MASTIRCAQSGENHCGFAAGYRVSIQRDDPLIVRGLHLVSLPKAALNVVRTGFSAELSPDCRSAWTEQFSQRVQSVSKIAHRVVLPSTLKLSAAAGNALRL